MAHKYCTNCAQELRETDQFCPNCGTRQIPITKEMGPIMPVVDDGYQNASNSKSHIAAGLLAIFVGGLGIHKFYLGYTQEGLILLILSLVLAPLTLGISGIIIGALCLIEGIIYLTKTDEEFYETYVADKKPWF